MTKIIIPETKGRKKTTARGLWRDEAGHLFYDYITIQTYKDDNAAGLHAHVENLRRFYKQEAIFYCSDVEAFCFYSRDKIDRYTTRHVETAKTAGELRRTCKAFLKAYKGLTIYRQPDGCIVEAWSA